MTPAEIGVDPNAALLGEIVTWDLAAMEVGYQAVQDALQAAGLPTGEAKHLRAQTAFSRAVKDLREGRAIDRVTTDKTAGTIVFQFTRKGLDSAGARLDFNYEALCTLATDTGDITCPDSPEIEQHARTMFAHAMAHRTTSDVTRLVQRLFAAHADLYPINPKKGVAYFVPEPHRDFSAKVEDFLKALGGRLDRFPVPSGTSEGNAAVQNTVEDGLSALAGELQDAVDAWDEKTRPSTMEKATDRLQTIFHKTESYAEYLGDRQSSLLADLTAQKKRLAAKILQVTDLKEEKKSAPSTPDTNGDTQRPLFPGATAPIATDQADEQPADMPEQPAPAMAGGLF